MVVESLISCLSLLGLSLRRPEFLSLVPSKESKVSNQWSSAERRFVRA